MPNSQPSHPDESTDSPVDTDTDYQTEISFQESVLWNISVFLVSLFLTIIIMFMIANSNVPFSQSNPHVIIYLISVFFGSLGLALAYSLTVTWDDWIIIKQLVSIAEEKKILPLFIWLMPLMAIFLLLFTTSASGLYPAREDGKDIGGFERVLDITDHMYVTVINLFPAPTPTPAEATETSTPEATEPVIERPTTSFPDITYVVSPPPPIDARFIDPIQLTKDRYSSIAYCDEQPVSVLDISPSAENQPVELISRVQLDAMYLEVRVAAADLSLTDNDSNYDTCRLLLHAELITFRPNNNEVRGRIIQSLPAINGCDSLGDYKGAAGC